MPKKKSKNDNKNRSRQKKPLQRVFQCLTFRSKHQKISDDVCVSHTENSRCECEESSKNYDLASPGAKCDTHNLHSFSGCKYFVNGVSGHHVKLIELVDTNKNSDGINCEKREELKFVEFDGSANTYETGNSLKEEMDCCPPFLEKLTNKSWVKLATEDIDTVTTQPARVTVDSRGNENDLQDVPKVHIAVKRDVGSTSKDIEDSHFITNEAILKTSTEKERYKTARHQNAQVKSEVMIHTGMCKTDTLSYDGIDELEMRKMESTTHMPTNDIYNDEDEQIQALLLEGCDTSDVKHISVSEPHLIDNYSDAEWKGDTEKAQTIKQGYTDLKYKTGFEYIRVIRGDNYCGIRATVYQALCNGVDILTNWRHSTPELLIQEMLESDNYWIFDWSFANHSMNHISDSPLQILKICLEDLWEMVAVSQSYLLDRKRYDVITDVFNKHDGYDIRLFEAVKFLMAKESTRLFNEYTAGNDVPTFAVLLFARDTSPDPEQFMRKHLNSVGDTCGLDQIEMCLLAHTLGVVLRVVRPNNARTSSFIVEYPEAVPGVAELWLVAEDDRHYNVLSENLDAP